MSDIQINVTLNDNEQLVLTRLTDEFNATGVAQGTLTPVQFLRQHAKDWIRSQAGRFRDHDQQTLRSAYDAATPTEQATVDSLLNKYR